MNLCYLPVVMFFIRYFVLINVMLFGHLRAVIPNLFKYKDLFYCKIFFQSKHNFVFRFFWEALKKFFKIMLLVEFILITSASSYTSQIIVQICVCFTWFEDI